MLYLGLIGHQRTMDITSQLIEQYYTHIKVTKIPMNTMNTSEVVSWIKSNESGFDGMLFTGKIPYDLINTEMISKKPWVYIQHDASRLLSGLLEASLSQKYDITKISIDSYPEDEVYEIYKNINTEILDIQVSNNSIFHETFLEDIKAFHKQAFLQKGVSVCITGISTVYEYLTEHSIPCIALDPTKQSIEEALRYLESKKEFQNEKSSQIVVIAIERDLPNEHALIKENEYQLALESMKISEEIYHFSQRVQAAVVEKEIGKYLLFTTKYLLELETEELQKLNIITKQIVQRFGTLSIGIGYGQTAREAKYNANLGLIKAKKHGGNQAYKVENNQYIGPIRPSTAQNEPINHIDGPFQRIASTAGISLNSVIKLQTIIDQQKSDTFTSDELAKLYGVSTRSMNRLLEKLLDTKYAQIVGCNIRTRAGRPSRIIKLCLISPIQKASKEYVISKRVKT